MLTLLISWEVFSRYVLGKPHAWMLDVQIMLYGVLFMMAGAYTLAKNGHVRGDVLYGFFRPRTQATLDLILYILFFLPGVVALTWAGWIYFTESLAIREQTFNADPIPVYPFKFVIPFAGAILLLQGLVGDRALHHLHPRRRLAIARAGRRGSRRRQAQGHGPRQGRRHRGARPRPRPTQRGPR